MNTRFVSFRLRKKFWQPISQSFAPQKLEKKTLVEFVRAYQKQDLTLEPTQDVQEFLKTVQSIKGIGPWTANYMAMKALRHTDSFPGSDLILARALDKHPRAIVDRMSPWRGYVAALFWKSYTQSLKKKNLNKKGEAIS